ncbi:MAG: response regulator [Gammaproteobacteria bacterium]|nr:response regulator [Gammaproteobacteria bacterium]
MGIANFKGKKVLVVDDAAFIRNLVKKSLEVIGITGIKEAVDGRQALAALQTGKYDLVISDLNMPEMDGIELLREIRADERMFQLPFIMLTSDMDAENIKAAAGLDVNGYITKPFRGDPLIDKVTEVLSKK